MVVMVHLSSLEAASTLPFFKMLVVEYIQQWHIGVVIFFVLSGFLITTRYADRIEPRWAWFGRYLQNRFARIYPIYFLLTAFTFVVMVGWPTHGWWEWNATYTAKEKLSAVLLNVTLLRAYFNQFSVLGLPTAWSLTVEETFYLVAPLLLLGLRRNPWRMVVYPLLLLGFVLVAFCGHFLPCYGLMKDVRFMLGITFFGHSAEFVWGMALALWVARQPKRASRRTGYTVAGAGGILFYMLVLSVPIHLYPSLAHLAVEGIDWSYGLIVASNVVLLILVCGLLWGLISEQTLLRRLLETRLLVAMGKASYVLYLLHLGTVDYLFRKHVSGNSLVCIGAYTVISLVLY